MGVDSGRIKMGTVKENSELINSSGSTSRGERKPEFKRAAANFETKVFFREDTNILGKGQYGTVYTGYVTMKSQSSVMIGVNPEVGFYDNQGTSQGTSQLSQNSSTNVDILCVAIKEIDL